MLFIAYYHCQTLKAVIPFKLGRIHFEVFSKFVKRYNSSQVNKTFTSYIPNSLCFAKPVPSLMLFFIPEISVAFLL